MTTHVLPGLRANSSGELLFVSSIYPIDDAGQVIGSDAVSPFVGRSPVEVQTRAVLDELADVVTAEGSSLQDVLRVEVQLAAAADFHELKLAWGDVFGDDPPARTTVVIGDDDWIVPGCRVCANAVAIAGESDLIRETI